MNDIRRKKIICILIPAHNEERVIGSTIQSLFSLVSGDDIYVVNDGSTDSTESVAKSLVPNVLTLHPNVGKAATMNAAISHFRLVNRYKYIMPMDADTVVQPDFLSHVLPILENDADKTIACAVGKVIGRSNNWVTLYRVWEYEIAQYIHKSAQGKEQAIIVCPGCSTVYRSEVFKKLSIPTGTLAEDMDFTFLLHRLHIGKIVYVDKARVVTQDPNNIKDLFKQLDRWYTGFWQCLIKHNIPWEGQTLDFEVALLALEGLFNGLLIIALTMFVPLALSYNPRLLVYPLSLDFIFFFLPTMILAAHRHRLWRLLLHIPHFYFLRMASSFIFFKSFIKVMFSFDRKMVWGKATRY